jgi:hypothetical protein
VELEWVFASARGRRAFDRDQVLTDEVIECGMATEALLVRLWHERDLRE